MIGGLTSDRALKLVRGMQSLNIVGMDVVEVAPAYDQSEITALAAATLGLEMLYLQAAKTRLTPGHSSLKKRPPLYGGRFLLHLSPSALPSQSVATPLRNPAQK